MGTAHSAFKTMTRVRIKHIAKPLYFLCLDPRDEKCGLFVDDWGTVEPYPMRYVEEAPKTVEEIAAEWAAVGEAADIFEVADAGTPALTAWYQAIITAAIEEASHVL